MSEDEKEGRPLKNILEAIVLGGLGAFLSDIAMSLVESVDIISGLFLGVVMFGSSWILALKGIQLEHMNNAEKPWLSLVSIASFLCTFAVFASGNIGFPQ